MSDDRVQRFWNELTPDQREDVDRFGDFYHLWLQDDADFMPDEWAKAEQVRQIVIDILGVDQPVSVWAGWLRACELFNAMQDVEQA